MRLFASIAAVAVLAASPAFAGSPGPSGTWSGQMRQIDKLQEKTYPMELTFAGKKATTSYPSLKCVGALSKIAEVKGVYTIYKETIKNDEGGACIDGLVIVQQDADKLILGWFAAFEGEPTLASAVLARAGK
jgi:hypothetical protein